MRAVPAAVAVLAAGLFCLPAVAADATATGIVVRAYDVLPSIAERISDVNAGRHGATTETDRTDWKEFFRSMGVEWPPGSFIKYNPVLRKVLVGNTEENLCVFEDRLQETDVVSSQVEIEAQFVAFQRSDIATAGAKGIVDVESLTALRQKGKAELLAAPKVLTQSGMEAMVKGVTEYIYPRESRPNEPTGAGGASGTTVPVGGIVSPGSFETREVGGIMTVLPTVTPEGQLIALTLAPQFMFEPVWRDYGLRRQEGSRLPLRMEQPFFHSDSVQTSLLVKNGETIVACGGMAGKAPEKVVYLFVTARLIGPDGKPVKRPEITGSER
jgi:type II secretory pathway component GspD/PulD (secretin)